MKLKLFLFASLFLIHYQAHSQRWLPKGSEIYGLDSFYQSGYTVAINSSGNTITVGDFGSHKESPDVGLVRIFSWDGAQWLQKGSPIRKGSDSTEEQGGPNVSMSSDGNTIAIGAPYNNKTAEAAGLVRVFDWSGSNWEQRGVDLYGDSAMDQFGKRVVLSANGNLLAVAAPGAFEVTGYVRVYHWVDNKWTQRGDDLRGSLKSDFFGFGLDMSADGSLLAIGAPFNDDNGDRSGQVKVYRWTINRWVQYGSTLNGSMKIGLGYHLDFDSTGNTLAIGAPFDGSRKGGYGSVHVYEWRNWEWKPKGDVQYHSLSDNYGQQVKLSQDGNILVISAPQGDADEKRNNGFIRTLQWNGADWLPLGQLISGDSASDNLGLAMDLGSDGRTLVVGARNNSWKAPIAGQVKVYYLCEPTLDTVSVQSWCQYRSVSGKLWTASGQYRDTILNGVGCDSIITVNLLITDAVLITSQSTQSDASVGDTISLFVESSATGYQWQSDTGFGYFNLANGLHYQGVNRDTLTILNLQKSNNWDRVRCITNYGSCKDTTEEILINVKDKVGINQIDQHKEIAVYPNPTDGNFTIAIGNTSTGIITTELLNSLGRPQALVYKKSNDLVEVKTSGITSGLYMLRVSFDDGSRLYERLVVIH